MRVAVDEARDDAAPAGVDGARRPRRPPRSIAATRRPRRPPRRRGRARAAFAELGSLVTSRPMRSIASRGHAVRLRDRRAQLGGDVERAWLPSLTTSRPPQTTLRDVRRGGAEDDRLERVSAVVPASRTRVERRSSRGRRGAPGFDPPGVGQPEAACPAAVAARSSAAAAWRPRSPLARRSSSSTARASSKHVDHRVRIAAERQRGAGVRERARRADAVGEIALGRRTEAAATAAAAEQPRRRRR